MSGIHHFLSYFTRHKVVKMCIISGATFIIAALIDAVFFLNVLNMFTNDFIDAAMLLRMTYESTLMFIGYTILLFGMLSSAFSMLRDHRFKSNSKKLQIQFIILSSFIISFFIARTFVVLLSADINPACQLWMKGYRVHHFFFGIGLLVIGGWLGHFQHGRRLVTWISAGLYGGGLGLVVDEFGLLLTFGDYWAIQSYIFFVLISQFFLITLLFESYKVFNASRA